MRLFLCEFFVWYFEPGLALKKKQTPLSCVKNISHWMVENSVKPRYNTECFKTSTQLNIYAVDDQLYAFDTDPVSSKGRAHVRLT